MSFSSGYLTSRVTVLGAGAPPTVFLLSPFYYQSCASLNGAADAGPNAYIVSISWNWGDGSKTNGWFPQSHVYTTTGTYLVNVSATDNNGLTGSSTDYITITNNPDPAPPQLSLSDPAVNGLVATVNGVANLDTCGPSPVPSFRFNWGDGTTNTGYFPQTHNYGSPGTRAACVTVVDSLGLAGKDCTSVTTGSTGFAGSGPDIANATIGEQQTSLELWPQGKTYIYGYATGGGSQSENFTYGQYASVVNQAGYTVAALAITNKPTDSFTTNAFYTVIGGVALSTTSYTASSGTNDTLSPDGATDHFVVTGSHSLVVLVALGGGEQCIELSGLSDLQIDASSPTTDGNLGLIIAHTYLDKGNYAISELTSQCAAGQDPSHAGDLIGAFVFSPTNSTITPDSGQNSPQLTFFGIPIYYIGGFAIATAGVVSFVAVSRLRHVRGRTRKNMSQAETQGQNFNTQSQLCPKCGTPLPEVAVFCGKCRTRVKQ